MSITACPKVSSNLMKAFLCLVLFLQVGSAAQARESMGHEGNGGDAVEAFFIEKGKQILKKLSRTPEGQKFLESLPVSYSALESTLDHRWITVSNETLHDVTGAIVDALVEDGFIYLNRQRWLHHMNTNALVETIVFHEMLRALTVNDDNYIYSGKVVDFSDYQDPAERLSLSAYIFSNHVVWKEVRADGFTNIDFFPYVNNREMALDLQGPKEAIPSATKISAHEKK